MNRGRRRDSVACILCIDDNQDVLRPSSLGGITDSVFLEGTEHTDRGLGTRGDCESTASNSGEILHRKGERLHPLREV